MQAFETELVGKRQSLADVIANIQVTTHPFTSMLQKRTRPKNQPHSWQAEMYPDVSHEGVPDGKDVDTFDSQARLLLQVYSQKFWRNPAVSDFSDEAEVAGAGGGEFARQKAVAMVLLKRKMEQRFLSASDTALTGKTYETRGMFSWISSTAQTTFPVPNEILTPAAQIYTGTLANFKERGATSFASMCASSFIQRKGQANMDAFLGIKLKQAFTEFTSYQETVSNFTAVRQFTRPGDSKTLTSTIDTLVTDTGTYRLHTSAFLRKAAATGADVAGTHLSGLVIDMDMVALAYTRLPRIFPQENKGGGPRAICDAIALCMCDNPQGMMKMQIDS
jgi:hypothetical protein